MLRLLDGVSWDGVPLPGERLGALLREQDQHPVAAGLVVVHDHPHGRVDVADRCPTLLGHDGLRVHDRRVDQLRTATGQLVRDSAQFLVPRRGPVVRLPRLRPLY